MEDFKNKRGIILHVVGAPGTGKSANIHYSFEELGLNIYEASLVLDNPYLTPRMVFKRTLDSMKDDLGVKTDEELYQSLKEFDAVLFADKFHDSHLLNENNIGFSQWTAHNGLKTFPYYVLCLEEYIKRKKEFNELNIVLQTAWRVKIGGKKRDLFTDFGALSRASLLFLKIPFRVVEISYSPEETISIVKIHLNDVDESLIREYITIYGCRPRFICENIQK
ncbi:MAG TPA: hypothetical protein VK444_05515 [Methanobacteriaceae archaeon]|nr:hypothetical protein [Methanobacteriaceae archaeon]